ncbi:hypothetical protein AGIG_G24888 [Arapaima gigas]
MESSNRGVGISERFVSHPWLKNIAGKLGSAQCTAWGQQAKNKVCPCVDLGYFCFRLSRAEDGWFLGDSMDLEMPHSSLGTIQKSRSPATCTRRLGSMRCGVFEGGGHVLGQRLKPSDPGPELVGKEESEEIFSPAVASG